MEVDRNGSRKDEVGGGGMKGQSARTRKMPRRECTGETGQQKDGRREDAGEVETALNGSV